MNNLRKFEPWLIFFGSLALFLYGLFGRELVGFETRFAVFAQEMLQNGPSFFPTTYNIPYPDYPAGLTFLNFLCALPKGHLTTLTAILPSAVASSLTLVLIYKIALPTSREWGRIAVLLALFTYEFFDSARNLTTDPLVMLACTWAFYLVSNWRAKALKTLHSSDILLLWLALPLVFGFIIRGPIGLIMPAGVVIAFFAAELQWKKLFQFAIQAFILLVILMVFLLSAAKYQGGNHFVANVLIMQIIGRLDDHRTHDFFAYFTNSFVNYAVSFELAIASTVLWLSNTFLSEKQIEKPSLHDKKLIQSIILWALIILVGMSIPEVRKIRYIIPMVPALALLAAYLWIIPQRKITIMITDIFHSICLALPFIFILLVIATVLVSHLKNINISAHYFSGFCTLGLFALGSIYILFHHPIHYARRNPKKVIGLGLASFLAAMIFIVKPIEVSLDRIKPFVTDVLVNLSPNQSITFFQVGPDAEPIQFLSGLPQPVSIKIYFVDQIDFNHADKTLYITKADIFDTLPDDVKQKLQPVLREKLGHREMVAFKPLKENSTEKD